ncbi:MAG: hypothetical protein MHPSP_000147 [Paramarteilia canceri]
MFEEAHQKLLTDIIQADKAIFVSNQHFENGKLQELQKSLDTVLDMIKRCQNSKNLLSEAFISEEIQKHRQYKLKYDTALRKLNELEKSANSVLSKIENKNLEQTVPDVKKTVQSNLQAILEEEEKVLNEQENLVHCQNDYKVKQDCSMQDSKLIRDRQFLTKRTEELMNINDKVHGILVISNKLHQDIQKDREKIVTIEDLMKTAEKDQIDGNIELVELHSEMKTSTIVNAIVIVALICAIVVEVALLIKKKSK